MKERSLLRRFRWIILIVVWGGAQLAGTAFLYHDSDLAMAGFIIFMLGCCVAVALANIDESNNLA